MQYLPVPPDAYWATIPWYGYVAVVITAVFLIFVAAPALLVWTKGLPVARQNSQDHEMIFVRGLIEERDRLAKQVRDTEERAAQHAREVEERTANQMRELEENRQDGWDAVRGCELLMHARFHDAANAMLKFNALLVLCGDLVDENKELSIAAFRQIIRREAPYSEMSPLPKQHEIPRLKPEQAWKPK